MFSLFTRLPQMVSHNDKLAGRSFPIATAEHHAVNGHSLKGPWPGGLEQAVFALGCFWGAERLFWQHAGVYVTAVGYTGGYTPNPTYRETCSGQTGHAEAVLVVFDPAVISYAALLKLFWESHDPTQGMRQGNDIGTQYRSAIYTCSQAHKIVAEQVREIYQNSLIGHGKSPVTTEIVPLACFYYAEAEHQQYLGRIPNKDTFY